MRVLKDPSNYFGIISVPSGFVTVIQHSSTVVLVFFVRFTSYNLDYTMTGEDVFVMDY